VHIGANTLKIKTDADCNDISETEYPHHDMAVTGMFGFLCRILDIYLSVFNCNQSIIYL